MSRQFWEAGGEYLSPGFDRLVDGTPRVFGPFQVIERAREVCSERSGATPAHAQERYAIVTNAG